jgi:hypothetical protein
LVAGLTGGGCGARCGFGGGSSWGENIVGMRIVAGGGVGGGSDGNRKGHETLRVPVKPNGKENGSMKAPLIVTNSRWSISR